MDIDKSCDTEYSPLWHTPLTMKQVAYVYMCVCVGGWCKAGIKLEKLSREESMMSVWV